MLKKSERNRASHKLVQKPPAPLSQACQIDRAADAQLALGRVATAERLSNLAAELRECGSK